MSHHPRKNMRKKKRSYLAMLPVAPGLWGQPPGLALTAAAAQLGMCGAPCAFAPHGSRLPGAALPLQLPARHRGGGRASSARRAKESLEEEAQRRGGGRGTKGMYVRPSKALEVGGGFYVPGLEGYRLRVAIVGLVLTLLALNRLLLPDFEPEPSQVVSESITVLTALFVLAQALFDAVFKGGEARSAEPAGPAADAEAEQPPAAAGARLAAAETYVDPGAGAGQRDKLQWLMGAALQAVQAGSSALVVGSGSRVAAAGAGAGAPSAAQVWVLLRRQACPRGHAVARAQRPTAQMRASDCARAGCCGGQVEEALSWMRTERGVVRMVARGEESGSSALFVSLAPGASQALVAVADAGDVAVVVGVRDSAGRSAGQGDANEAAWLKALANMPL